MVSVLVLWRWMGRMVPGSTALRIRWLLSLRVVRRSNAVRSLGEAFAFADSSSRSCWVMSIWVLCLKMMGNLLVPILFYQELENCYLWTLNSRIFSNVLLPLARNLGGNLMGKEDPLDPCCLERVNSYAGASHTWVMTTSTSAFIKWGKDRRINRVCKIKGGGKVKNVSKGGD